MIVIALLLAAGLAGWFGYSKFRERPADLSRVKPAFRITASDLIREFEANDSLANNRYLGQVLEVTGPVKDVTKDESGFLTITLGDPSELSGIRCAMDSSHQSDAASVAAGASATIRGACTGFLKDEMGLGSDVILNRAVLVK